jgi:hypothetical protein
MHLAGTPSDDLPDVLATGETSAQLILISLSQRHPEGRDAEYIAWHSLDHRPEQYRLPGLRNAIRVASTPQCRAVRAASEGLFDDVDHVMTYMFTGPDQLPAFKDLGYALNAGGRMPIRLPNLGHLIGNLAGKVAAPGAVAGADVIPWRPALGVYLLVEEGQVSPSSLIDITGVAGIWWFDSCSAPEPFIGDSGGRRFTYLFLDADPVETGIAIGQSVRARWADGTVRGHLAAPFHMVAHFSWDRFLP